jgi:uncharacterized protein YjeT (DUF2065 family)
MTELAALAIVFATSLFFLGLGALALLLPAHAKRFLLAFATSPGKHYAELAIRILIGAAFVLAAPQLRASSAFHVFGLVLLCTSLVLLCLPWRWHQRFASRSVPQALQFLPLIGAAALATGGLILWALWLVKLG